MKKHLSFLGIGPFYVAFITLMTVFCLYLNYFKRIPGFSLPWSAVLGKLLAVLLVLAGVILWFNAAIIMKIDANIAQNNLVTSGAYAWVRNPIYSAFMFVTWGLLLWSGNLLLLLPCPFYWLLMTVLLKPTEEKWLKELYGEEYLAYCRAVNRCIPKPPKKK